MPHVVSEGPCEGCDSLTYTACHLCDSIIPAAHGASLAEKKPAIGDLCI